MIQPAPGFLEDAAAIGIEFEPGEVEKLGRYLSLLLETNKTHNLTAITEPAEMWRRHVLDSLTLVAVLSETASQRVSETGEGRQTRIIDVGSGGGLPGVPLAIVMPHVEFTLLEATGKKAEFLKQVAAELGLSNVRVVQARAERAGRMEEHRERYDAAVARAVGPMAVIAELCVPLVKVGGSVLLIKGQKAEEELAAAKKALHMLHAVHAGTVETPTGRIVVLDKPRKTPAAYPRVDGEPKRKPL